MAEEFDIRFSEQGAKDVVASMRLVTSEAGKAAVATEDLGDALAKVKSKADPAQAAYEGLAKNLNILTKAQQANLISADQYSRMSTNLAAGAERQIRPYGSLIAGIQAETKAYQQSGAARTATLRTIQQEATLKRQGIALNAEQVASLERVNLAYAQTREAAGLAEKAQADAARASVAASRTAEQAALRAAAAQAKRTEAVAGVGRRNAGQTAALGGGSQNAASLRTLEQVEALKRTGITLTAEETSAIEAQNVAYAEQKAALAEIASTKRALGSVRQQARTPQQNAISQYNQGSNTINRAQQLGLVGGGDAIALQRQLAQALNEQINPLDRTNRLLVERAEYQAGLSESGRALAQVERDIASAQELGIATSEGEIASLRQRAIAVDTTARAYASIDKVKGIFNSTVGGIGLLFGGEEVVKSLDQVQNLQNLLSVTSSGASNQAALTDKVFDISRETHSQVEDTAKLYTRLELGVEKFGVGQERVLAVTKEVNEQIRLSGTSQGEANRAVTDFAHAISAGNVQFRELRALTTQAPFVAKSIAEGLTKLAAQDSAFQKRAQAAGVNTAKGIGVGDLKALTSKKAIGSGDIFRAEELQAQATAASYAKLSPTISQALGDVHTEFLKFLNDVNNGTNLSHGLAGSIEFVADNLKNIIPPLIVVGALFAGAFVKNRIDDVVSIISTFAGKLTGVKPAATAAQIALDADTAAILANNEQLIAQNGLLTSNSEKFGINAVAVRGNAGARNLGVANTARNLTTEEIGSAAGGLEAGAGAGIAAEGATAATGIAAAEGASIGLGGALTAVGGALAAALPLVFALGAAFLLFKDNIDLAKTSTLAYSQDGITKTVTSAITLGDVVGGVWDAITAKSTDSAGVQQTNSAQTADAAAKAAKQQSDAATNAFNKTNDSFNQLNGNLLKGIVQFTSNFLIGADGIAKGFQIAFADIALYAQNAFNQMANSLSTFYNENIVPKINAISAATGGKAGKAIGTIGTVLNSGARGLANVALPGIGGSIYDSTIGNSVQAGANHLTQTGSAADARTNRQVLSQDQLAAAVRANTKTGIDGLKSDINGKFSANAIAAGVIAATGRRNSARPGGVTDGTGNPPDLDNGKAKKAKKDPLDNEFDELVKKVFPAVEAIRNLNKELEVLAKADAKGLIQKTADQINAYNKQYGVNITGVAGGSESSASLRAELEQREKEATLDSLDPSRSFVRDQQQKQQELAVGQTGSNPYQRTIDKGVEQEEQREATARKVNISQIAAEEGAKIRLELTNTSLAEQSAKVSESLASEREERNLQLSQLGETTELIKAQSDAYKIYAVSIQAGVPGAVAAYQAQVQSNLSFIAYTENIQKTAAAYNEIVAPANQFRDTVVNLNNLLAAGQISLAKYNQELRDGASKALATATDGFSGFQRAILDIKKETSDTASDMESTFKDAYNNVESGFQSLFTGGTLKDAAHKVFEGLTNDFSKTLFHKISDPLINSIGGKAGVPGFGDKAIQASRVDLNATTVYVSGQAGVAGAANNNLLGGNPAAAPTVPGYQYDPTTGQSLTDPGFAAGLNRFGVANTDPLGGLLNNNSNSLFTNPSTLSTTGFNIGNYNPLGLLPATSNLTGGLGNIGSSLSLPGSNLFSSASSGLGSLFGNTGAGLPGVGNPASSILGPLGGALGGAAGAPVPVTIVGGGGAGAGGLTSLLGGGGGASGGGGFLSSLLGGGGAAAGGGAGGLGFLSSIGSLFGFATGGQFDVGGTGGTDSKVVAFKATPGENVAVTTPGQQAAAANGQPAPQINQKIVNIQDPNSSLDALQTQQGEKVLMNFIQSNPEAIKRALG